jgi:mannan endo-1,4-beta-mannosidase
MSHLQTSGLKVLRVWGFNIVTSTPSSGTVWYQSLIPGQAAAINTGANGLQRLDYVVQSAAAHDIKLIINFNNNWSDYGGVPAYMSWRSITQAQWYTDATSQATYQAYIKAVVSRYSNSSAVFAWELMNEPRCSGCATSVLTSWATVTSAYIKSLDSKHLVTLGDEGFHPSAGDGTYPFGTSEGVSFVDNLAIQTLDFGTYHMYPDSWGVNETSWCTEWIQQVRRHSISTCSD